jgi:hypothetical protein
VKFIYEWAKSLESTTRIEQLADLTYDAFFNVDNSNEVNVTLLEMLPFYSRRKDHFFYVKTLSKHSNPALRAQAIFTLAENYTQSYESEVLDVILGTANDTNLTVMVRSSQACSFLATVSTDSKLVQLIIKFCKSGKEKTTANGIRALGHLQVEVNP